MRTVVVLGLLVAAAPALAEPPSKVGACARSKITAIGNRFEEKLTKPAQDDIDQGTTVSLANQTFGVSYSFNEPVFNSRVGDDVMTCLVALPKNCPKGDGRGRVYTTTNLRTLDSWTMPDSPHTCGGA